MALKGRSLISLRDFTCAEIRTILDLSRLMAEAIGLEGAAKRQSFEPMEAILAALFFEPSTRTRLSFESAMLRLGGQVLGFADASSSSVSKGETLADTIRVVTGYCDIMVIRHPVMGAAKVAADYGSVPVINAGDGAHEHPTQTLADLFAIMLALGRLDGLRVGLCGDLKYGRTVHSLAPVMARFGSEVVCIAPPELQMPENVLAEVESISGRRPEQTADLAAAVASVDVLYMTRIQRERFADPAEYERQRGVYVLTPQIMAGARDSMIVLHPLPRVDEISPEVDQGPGAWYFRQARAGVPVRMALISLLLGLEPTFGGGRRYGLDIASGGQPAPIETPAIDPPSREFVPDSAPCRQSGCITSIEPVPSQALRQADGTLVCAYCERPLP